ncbi:hypothetical protein N9924_00910 [bacterium]|nr:hypothetical protein [bacterium]
MSKRFMYFIVFILFVTAFICIGIQSHHINLNTSAIEDLTVQNVWLHDELSDTNKTIKMMQQYDVYQNIELDILKEMYDRDIEAQEIQNQNFVTSEKLQLEVQRCLENNLEVIENE